MKQKLKSALTIAYEQLGRTWFFVASLVVFFLHAAWLALSSNLLPYDEYYHIGIIKFYAQQWSPFISHQPPEVSYLGDLTRLPSYMYHYLMSFPYRFFHLFTQNETVLTILIRFMNIALVICGVILFRKLFMRGGLSKRLVNTVCAFFLFTPFVVMLAAENNYDNLMFFMTPVVMWYAYNIIKKHRLVVTDLVLYLGAGLFATLVKHSFAVILLVTSIYIALYVFRITKFNVQKTKIKLHEGSRKVLVFTAILITMMFALFIERHAYNMVKYRSINVNCAAVQPIQICKQYSPWWRNYRIKQQPLQTELYGNVASFAQHWAATMLAGLYPIFAQIPHEPGSRPDPYGDYIFMHRLALLLGMAYAMAAVGTVAVLLKRKEIAKNELLKMQAVIAASLVLTLFVFNYRTYLTLTKAYAVQVRYLFPLMLPLLIVFAFSMNHVVKQAWVKKGVVLALLCIYIWCGGIVGWIIRSETNWYWPNQTVITLNQNAQNILKRIVPN